MSTPFDVLMMMQCAMSKADPLAATRMRRLQAYCKRMKWIRENGDWATNVISQNLGKPANKISDLLRGRGSFGAKIARELESASNGGMPLGYLDELIHLSEAIPGDALGGFVPSPASPPPSPRLDVDLLGAWLLQLSEADRAEASSALADLARYPDSALARRRVARLIESSGLPQPPSWRETAIEYITEIHVNGKTPNLDTLIRDIDTLHSERVGRVSAKSARPTLFKS